jgi:hypothetical protein
MDMRKVGMKEINSKYREVIMCAESFGIAGGKGAITGDAQLVGCTTANGIMKKGRKAESV